MTEASKEDSATCQAFMNQCLDLMESCISENFSLIFDQKPYSLRY